MSPCSVNLGLIEMVRRLQKLYVHASHDRLHALSYSAKYDLVLDNSFKQTPHHLNQLYLMWASVLCQRSSRTWNLLGHAFPPRGSGLQMLHDKAGLGLSKMTSSRPIKLTQLLITESASIEVKHMRGTKNTRVYQGTQAREDELRLFSVFNL